MDRHAAGRGLPNPARVHPAGDDRIARAGVPHLRARLSGSDRIRRRAVGRVMVAVWPRPPCGSCPSRWRCEGWASRDEAVGWPESARVGGGGRSCDSRRTGAGARRPAVPDRVGRASRVRTGSRSGPIPTPPMMARRAGSSGWSSSRRIRAVSLPPDTRCEHFDHAARSARTDTDGPDGASLQPGGPSVRGVVDRSRRPLRGASGDRRAAGSGDGGDRSRGDVRPAASADDAGRVHHAVRARRLPVGEAAARPAAQPEWRTTPGPPISAPPRTAPIRSLAKPWSKGCRTSGGSRSRPVRCGRAGSRPVSRRAESAASETPACRNR